MVPAVVKTVFQILIDKLLGNWRGFANFIILGDAVIYLRRGIGQRREEKTSADYADYADFLRGFL